jgi:hypothetical protein
MRLIIGKKIKLPRDEFGKAIKNTLTISPFFPDWLIPSIFKLENEMEKRKLRVINFVEMKETIIWEKMYGSK